jgi:hypothetical protein
MRETPAFTVIVNPAHKGGAANRWAQIRPEFLRRAFRVGATA